VRRSIYEIADTAFRNYLRSLRRPVTLREGLVESLRMIPTNEHASGIPGFTMPTRYDLDS
jgi:hypothetical protein